MKIQHLDTQKRVLIVAEIGNNHEGRFDVAERLVREAARAGVDAVKFQTFKTEYYISPSQVERYQRLKSFELTQDQFRRLHHLAKSLGLLFISTPLDLRSAAFLNTLVDAFKVASGDNNFYPLIDFLSRKTKPLIISTGLTALSDVRRTYRFIRKRWGASKTSRSLALLHCVSSYPVPDEQAHLRAIPYLKQRFPCTVGYSDHTLGIDASAAAVALGAEIIEKHFTLDKHFSNFRDHQLSADPRDMQRLVKNIRRIETLLGTPGKSIQTCEKENNAVIRRAIVAALPLKRGHRLKLTDLLWVRPASLGLSAGSEHRLLGHVLNRDIAKGEPILLSAIQR